MKNLKDCLPFDKASHVAAQQMRSHQARNWHSLQIKLITIVVKIEKKIEFVLKIINFLNQSIERYPSGSELRFDASQSPQRSKQTHVTIHQLKHSHQDSKLNIN